jgi:predicted ATP-grasp superfamily ATP-dependent carboligase
VRGDREAAPLLAGWQNISCRDAGPGRRVLAYDGGELPADEHHSMRAIALARRAVAAVPGLRGFVGVDVVLGDGPRDDVVIEINPRLTMSYVALRRLCIDNLAAALVFPDAPIRWRPGRVAFDAAGRLRAEQPA